MSRPVKLYPDPFKNEYGLYSFCYKDKLSNVRKVKSTGLNRKDLAREFIHVFMDKQNAGLSTSTLREYADKFFIWEECPRVQRLLQEGHSIGKTHVRMSRRWMERFIFTDKIANMPMSEIRRGHVIDFRTRLTKVTVEKKVDGENTKVLLGVNTINMRNIVFTVYCYCFSGSTQG